MKKTKQILILFFSIFGVINASNKVKDSIVDSIEYNISTNKKLNKISSIKNAFIYADLLYLVDGAKSYTINLKNKEVTSNLHLNQFLLKHLKKGNYTNKIVVDETGFYIGFTTNIYHLSYSGKEDLIYTQKNEIYHFNITSNKNILISVLGKILLFNTKTNHLTEKLNKELKTPDYFSLKEGIGYNQIKKFILYNEINGSIVEKSIDAKKVKIQDENFFPTFASETSLIGFSYFERDKIFQYQLDDFHNNPNLIRLNKNYSPSKEVLMQEEGSPNFTVLENSSFLYAISLVKNKLNICKIKTGNLMN